MLNHFLNKGGAGRSFSRAETVERLAPVLRRHNVLLSAYDQVISHLQDRDLANALDASMNRSRADAGKLSEVILSNGSPPPLGTDIEPDSMDLGAGDDVLLKSLLKLEQAHADDVAQEYGISHTLHAKAILENVLANSRARLRVLTQRSRRVPQL